VSDVVERGQPASLTGRALAGVASAAARAGGAFRRDASASLTVRAWRRLVTDASASLSGRALGGAVGLVDRVLGGSWILRWFCRPLEAPAATWEDSVVGRGVLDARGRTAERFPPVGVVRRAVPRMVTALLYVSGFLIALVPFTRDVGPIPLAADFVLLLVLIALWIADVTTREGFRMPRSAFDLLFLAYVGVAVVSIVGTFSVVAAVRALFRQLSYFMLFYIVLDMVRDRKRLHRLVAAVLCGAAVVALYGVVQYVIGVSEQIGVAGQGLASNVRGRVYSTQDNPNFLSEYLILLLPVAVAMFLRKGWWFARLFYLGTAGVMTLTLLLTYTRAGWVGAALGMMLFFGLYNWRYLGLFAAAGAAGILALPGVLQRLTSITRFVSGSGGFRLQLFRTAAAMIAHRPVFGVGIGNYLEVYPHTIARYPTYDVGFAEYSSHNSFLTVTAEMGIAGLLVFLWIVLRALRQAFSGWVHLSDPGDRLLSLGIGCGMVAFLTQSFSNVTFFHPRVTVYYWFLLAVAVALWRIAGTDRAGTNEQAADSPDAP
jgi:O-antigen ligase